MEVVLETERLLLRRFTLDDVDALVELDSDPEVTRFITNGAATPRAEVEERVLHDSYHVATLDNDAPEVFAGSLEFVRVHVPAAAG